MRFLTTAALSLALFSSEVVIAQEVQPLQFLPSTDWALDYGDDYCRLAREFEHAGNRATLAIERIHPGPVARIMISGDGVSPQSRARRIGFQFMPGGEPRSSMLLQARVDGGHMVNLGEVYIAPVADSVTREDRRALRARYDRQAEASFTESITGILVNDGLTEGVLLQTGELGGPFAALQVCADELLTHWGLDAERHQTLRRPVTPANDMTTWLPPDLIDRRSTALLVGGQNQVRLMIDSQGTPTACAVHLPSLTGEMNDAVCSALLQNARFSPAQDASGTPLESYWITQLGVLAPRGG